MALLQWLDGFDQAGLDWIGDFGGVSLLVVEEGGGETKPVVVALLARRDDSIGEGGLTTVGELGIGVSGLMVVSGLLMSVDMMACEDVSNQVRQTFFFLT